MLFNAGIIGASAVGGGDSDPHFANVSLLCGFDGSTTDESANNFALTAVGDATISPDDPILGTGSLLLDGSGDWVTAPSNDAFNFGSGDFTIELWVRFASIDNINTRGLIATWVASPNSAQGWLVQRSSGRLSFGFRTSSLTFVSVVGPLFPVTLGQDYYVAVSRSGSTFTFSIDGVTSAATQSATINNGTAELTIGTHIQAASVHGRMDEVRITKGVARDISVVPSGKFPRS